MSTGSEATPSPTNRIVARSFNNLLLTKMKTKMKKSILPLLMGIIASVFTANAQEGEKESPLLISGSVDTYYKYDFSGESQIGTSFAGSQNSISIGMVDVVLEKSIGKVSFVGEIAFGPRASNSAPGPIQQLYIAYDATDKLRISGGFMSTYIGYEVISPTGNLNYSTSYLFSNGPFQQGGVKLDYAVSDRFALMVGVFNEFDSYTNTNGGMDLGAQLYLAPIAGLDLYFNFVTSDDSGTETDLTATYQASEKFLVGLNVAQRTSGSFYDTKQGAGVNFSGAAAYLNYTLNEVVALGLRGEYFTDMEGSVFGVSDPNAPGQLLSTPVTALTLSANIGSGAIKLIPEIRLDMAGEQIFENSNAMPTANTGQFLLAAYYTF